MYRRHDAATEISSRAKDLDASIDQLVGSRAKPTGWTPPRRGVHRALACITDDASMTNVLSWAREFARLLEADVTLIHVTRPVTSPAIYPSAGPFGLGAPAALPVPEPAVERERGERLLRAAKEEVARDAPDVTILHREGHPGDEIVRAARELASDLIILGHHQGGALDRLLLGSTTDHVKNHTHADVLVARSLATPGPILAAVDGSAPSRHAVAIADDIARRWGTTLHLLHVVPRVWHSSVDEAIAEELRARAVVGGTTTPLDGVGMELRVGEPRDTIRLAARGLNASLIAIGARGVSGLRSLMPGSVSNGIVHSSPTSVLLVRDDSAAE